MKKIGFADRYYTLWEYEAFIVPLFRDGMGIGSRFEEHYTYIKNISMDREVVEKQYPGIEINPELRGKKTYTTTKESYAPGYLYFGKYSGSFVSEIWERDPDYLKWLAGNTKNESLKQSIEALPGYAAPDKIEFASIETPRVGKRYPVVFLSNPKPDNEAGWVSFAWSKSSSISFFAVVFDEYKDVSGRYPYRMPNINGRFVKINGKKVTIQVEEILGTVSQRLKYTNIQGAELWMKSQGEAVFSLDSDDTDTEILLPSVVDFHIVKTSILK